MCLCLRKRCNWGVIYQDELIHHHLSWCEPKDIYKKLVNYNHANEFNGDKWYREHFLSWKPGDIAIEPFGTRFNTKYDPLPTELQEYLS